MIEVDILWCEQVDRHIVDWFNLLFQYDSTEERVNTEVALLVSMLCDEERYTAFSQTVSILMHHVVAHNLNILTVRLQQELTHDMRFRVQCDAMMHLRMLAEELF